MKRKNFRDYMRGFVAYFDHLCKLVIRVNDRKAMSELSEKEYAKDCVLYLANMHYLTEYGEYTTPGMPGALNEIGALLFPDVDKRPTELAPIQRAIGSLVAEVKKVVDISINPEKLDTPWHLYAAATVYYYMRASKEASPSMWSYAKNYYTLFERNRYVDHIIVRDKKGQIMLKRSDVHPTCFAFVTPIDIKRRKYKQKKVYEPFKDHPEFALADKLAADQRVDEPYKQSLKKPKPKRVKAAKTKKSKKSIGGVILSVLGVLAFPFVKLWQGISAFFGGVGGAVWRGICAFFGTIGGGIASLFKKIGRAFRGRDDGDLTLVCSIAAGIAALYVVLELTGIIYKLSFPVGSNMLTQFYHFNLTRLAVSWLEAVDHTFLTAITLGLLQIILIVLGAITDVVIYIVLFLISIVIMIVLILLQLLYLMALPVIASIVAIVKFIRSDEKGALSAILTLAAIAMTVLYFVGIAPAL